MLNVVSIFNDSIDTIATEQNGSMSFPQFNRFSQRAEYSILDWLTGNNDILPPPPFQKNKDWISTFIQKRSVQIVNGAIDKPSDYYVFDNFYRIGSKVEADCDEDEVMQTCNTPIEIMDGQQFYVRCNTYIEEKKPSFKKPIAKIVGNQFEILPKDLGSVVLEYVRNPIPGRIITKMDLVYNEEIPDEDLSINYEWPDAVRDVLIFFIVDGFVNSTRENALKQFNTASKP